MRSKITKRVVDGVEPSARDQFVWDVEAKGFGLKITPKGARIYIVQTRVRGRLQRITIGRHGSPWTPEKARKRAKTLLGLAADGTDPSQHDLDKTRENMRVSDLCDLYVAEGSRTKKPKSRYNDGGLIRRHIKPTISSKCITRLTRMDIERMMMSVAEGKTALDEKTGFRGRAIVRGGEIAANNAVILLSSMLSFAMSRGLIPDNPAKGIQKYKSRARERFLSQAELHRLGETLEEMEQEGMNAVAVSAIRMLLLTGCRKNEILTLRWDWVDFEHGVLRLPDSKTGAKVVPLGRSAIDLLLGLSKSQGNPFVFPSSITSGHFVGLQKVWERIRARADLSDVRLHDLRHTYASVGAASGENLYIVGKLVGHRQHTTTQRYAHLADDPLRAAADRISSKISGDLAAQH